jgi:hypothetical protein
MSDTAILLRVIMRWLLVVLSFSAVALMIYYMAKAVYLENKKQHARKVKARNR